MIGASRSPTSGHPLGPAGAGAPVRTLEDEYDWANGSPRLNENWNSSKHCRNTLDLVQHGARCASMVHVLLIVFEVILTLYEMWGRRTLTYSVWPRAYLVVCSDFFEEPSMLHLLRCSPRPAWVAHSERLRHQQHSDYDEAPRRLEQVENQYRRRRLIPNLVETVKGYAKQEKDVLVRWSRHVSKVAQMQVRRTSSTIRGLQTVPAESGRAIVALSRLLVVVEKYPDSNQTRTSSPCSRSSKHENRISVARRDYIEAVKNYNTELRTIPGAGGRHCCIPTPR